MDSLGKMKLEFITLIQVNKDSSLRQKNYKKYNNDFGIVVECL
jgi:hypothetical protein